MTTKNQAHRLLEQCDIKPTTLRTEVLLCLLCAKKPIGAYDLLERLKIKRPGAKPMTIYRILDLYQAVHLVHKLEKDNTFVLCCHPDAKNPCQIIICRSCHKHTELHDDRLAQTIQAVLQPLGYRSCQQELQIDALCMQCQGNQ
jgi:Fur family zinc uptake transcriptional regulator